MTKELYRALVLDMDGTLMDSWGMQVNSLQQLAMEYGFTLTDDHLRIAFGSTGEALMAALHIERPEPVVARWMEIMAGMLDTAVLFPGVRTLLEAPLRRGIVTSETRKELTHNLARLDIASAFEVVVAVDDTPRRKPDPLPLLHCLKQMGVSPSEALFVGDTHYDYECALAAGVDFGLATWGAEPGAEFPKAKYHFHSPEDIIPLISIAGKAAEKRQKQLS